MAIKNKVQYRRFRIKQRIRKSISGTKQRPRLTVFRSNKAIYAQLIDDLSGNTLLAMSSMSKNVADDSTKVNKIEQAKIVGEALAKKALESGIASVVFDRNGYLYHGRVKALADAARKGGLKF
jgi:large subunit ribosomal protein L18